MTNIGFVKVFLAKRQGGGEGKRCRLNPNCLPPQISAEALRRSGPTRIPKPRGCGSPKGNPNPGVAPGPQTPRGLKTWGPMTQGKVLLNAKTTTIPGTASINNNNPNLANRKL
ncbi:unnamed protein product [Arctogadus glacialis]